MDLFVIRNKKHLHDLVELLQKRRLPFKVATDDIYPIRSLDLNAYYWGVVLKYISDESGHSVEECHERYKRMFNLSIEFKINDKGYLEPVLGIGSTAAKNNKEFVDYIFKVRADGELEHHIVIPNPNEAFVPSLDYDHDKIEQRRI